VSALSDSIYELGRLDTFAQRDTWVHRLDPRAKVVATLVFIVCVVSFPRYTVLPLVPFALFPLVLAVEGRVPLGWLGSRLLAASPFALMIGVFNPLLDTAVIATIGPLEITGGWASYASIVMRFGLTAAAALVLIATTGFTTVCHALERLKVPEVFTVQLLFLYRYLFVLAEEGLRLVRARDLRSFGKRGTGLAVYGQLLGHLLLRTYARAQRVYSAMLLRGFDGRVRIPAALTWRSADLAFTALCCAAFVLARAVDLTALIGSLVT